MAALTITAFGLRGASAAAKFLLVMYIASMGDGGLMGQVAILTTIVALFTQVAGLEVNQVIGRRLHRLTPVELISTLRGLAATCFCSYAILVPISLLVYPDLLLPFWPLAGLILTLEHFITEVYRLNILLLRPVFASCLLFVKNAGWVILFVGLTATHHTPMTFSLLLYCWAGVLLLTAVPLIVLAWRHNSRHQGTGISVAFDTAAKMVKQALPFITSAVLTAGIGAIDKLMIGKAFQVSELGTFFFFATCASVLTLVVTFSVGSTSGPKCIKVHATQGRKAFRVCLRRLKQQYWAVILSVAAFILAFASPLLEFLNKPTYVNHFNILILLVTSAAFVSLCDPYKLDEYLSNRDSCLVIGNGFHLFSLILAVAIGARTSRIDAVAAGVMLSSVVTFVFFYVRGPRRVARFLRLWKRKKRMEWITSMPR